MKIIRTKICRQKIYHSDNELMLLFSGAFRKNNLVRSFENRFSEFVGTGKGYATSSATYALHLILKKFQRGSEIILPSYTNHTIPAMILHMGLKPVFVKVGDDFNIKADEIEEKITDRSKAIIATHMFGEPADMNAIVKIACENNLEIVEDCVHAIGTEHNGKRVGSIGDYGIFSFGSGKMINCYGGGMITAKKDVSVERLNKKSGIVFRIIKNKIVQSFTKYPLFDYLVFPALKYSGKDLIDDIFQPKVKIFKKMPKEYICDFSNAQAALGLRQIEGIKAVIKRLKDNGERYDEAFGVRHKGNYFIYPTKIKDKAKIVRKLRDKGIDVRQNYFGYTCGNLFGGKFDDVEKDLIFLPNYPGLDVERVIKALGGNV